MRHASLRTHSPLQITERLLESEERKLSILKGELASVDQGGPVGASKVGGGVVVDALATYSPLN